MPKELPFLNLERVADLLLEPLLAGSQRANTFITLTYILSVNCGIFKEGLLADSL